MNFVIKLRIFLWSVLVIIVGWLLYMGVVPGGKVSYVCNFTKDSYFIGKLTPDDRVEKYNNTSVRITGDPVYFALRTPRKFDKAKLTLKYKSGRQGASVSPAVDIIEAGVLVDKTIWRYDLQPIENKIIDQLALVWDVIQENDLVLLQRKDIEAAESSSKQLSRFNSVADFLNNLPDKNEIALYNYDLKAEFLLSDYAPTDERHLLGTALRGPFEFYTYIKEEDLDFIFAFQDLNNNRDSDPVDLHLYYNGQLIDSRHLDDDGITVDSGEDTDRGEMKLKLTNLPEGIYKIELRVNDDIITKRIATKQWKLAFVNKIWLADGGNKDIIMYTDSRKVSAQTINPSRLQTIRVGDNDLKVEQTYKQFNIKAKQDVSEIKLAKDDIILAGDGVFSFSRDSLINPNFSKVGPDLNINQENINYILAKYTIPDEKNGWRIAQAEFDLTKAYREDAPRQLGMAGKYSFLISIPGLRADDDINDYVEIGEIRVDLEGKSLWDKIKDLLK